MHNTVIFTMFNGKYPASYSVGCHRNLFLKITCLPPVLPQPLQYTVVYSLQLIRVGYKDK